MAYQIGSDAYGRRKQFVS